MRLCRNSWSIINVKNIKNLFCIIFHIFINFNLLQLFMRFVDSLLLKDLIYSFANFDVPIECILRDECIIFIMIYIYIYICIYITHVHTHIYIYIHIDKLFSQIRNEFNITWNIHYFQIIKLGDKQIEVQNNIRINMHKVLFINIGDCQLILY